MEPKHLTLIQAAAIALVLSIVVVNHEPAQANTDGQPELAVAH